MLNMKKKHNFKKKAIGYIKVVGKSLKEGIPTREEVNQFRNDLGDLREALRKKLKVKDNYKQPTSDLMLRLWDLP